MPEDQPLSIHPAALAMPELPASEYQALKADIEENGQLVPILLLDGLIIDGRHRYRACEELDMECECEDIELEGMTPGQLVWGLNGQRRHLTPSVRAAIYLELCGEDASKAAKERQATSTGGAEPQLMANLPQAAKGTARDEIAAIADVSPRTIQDVQTVAKEAPELLPAIKAGEITASAAAKQVREIKKVPKPTKPSTPEATLGDEVAAPTADEAVACVLACPARMVVMRRVIEQLPPEMLIPIRDMIDDRLGEREEGSP